MKPLFSSLEDIHNAFLKASGVTTDSRNAGLGSLFFALRGASFDGNLFAADALGNGASFAVVDNPDAVTDSRCLLVQDSLKALQEVAALHRSMIPAKVIGITGSNGKTTTKELIHAVLGAGLNVVATSGNLNNHIGVPLTILRATKETQVLIVEMGANHPGEIAALCRIANPVMGLITNVGKAHLEGFGSLEGVKKAKNELYQHIASAGGTIFWNADDPVIEEMAAVLETGKVSYGTSPSATIRGSHAAEGMLLRVAWYHEAGDLAIHTMLAGNYNFPNVMAAVAVGVWHGIEPARIVKAISGYIPQNNRSQFLDTGQNQVVVDCYNANPASMRAAIGNFMAYGHEAPLLILGDMFELGDYSMEEHRMLLGWVTAIGVPCITIGNYFSILKDAFPFPAFIGTEEAAAYFRINPVVNRQVLLKGSRGVGLEKLLPYL